MTPTVHQLGHPLAQAIAAGVLAVVRPHMNGIGGDAFGIFYHGETGEVTALNASGRAGALATPEFFAAAPGLIVSREPARCRSVYPALWLAG